MDDDRAIDGLLRELARAPLGDDEAFITRVMSRTRRRSPSIRLAAAALILAAAGVLFSAPWEPATARIGFASPEALLQEALPDAARVRILMRDRSDRVVVLGDVPFGDQARVPASVPLRFQAVDRDGRALWTAPGWTELRPREVRSTASGPLHPLDPALARSADFAHDVKPLLEQHCGGCHSLASLVRADRVLPFDARRSPLVTQTHASLPVSERQTLALWIDLGAKGQP